MSAVESQHDERRARLLQAGQALGAPAGAALVVLLAAGSPPVRAGLVGLEPALAPLLVLAGLVLTALAWRARWRGPGSWRSWLRVERRLLARTALLWAVAAAVFVAPLLAHRDFRPTGRIAAFAQELGHLPWGDCVGHVAGANRLLAEGAFGAYSERRPMGASWLSALLGLTGERLAWALLLQAYLLGGGALLAARCAASRFGLGALPIVLGVALGVTRDYVPTAATEPLGMLLACLAVALLVSRGAASRPRVAALGAFALALALNARPGAQLLLPALLAWGVLVAPRPRWRAAALLAGAMLAASALTGVLNSLHGAGEAGFTTYPAYTFYGLTRNANYRVVARDFPEQLEQLKEKELARFLYGRAFQNLKDDPRPFLGALFGNLRKFAAKAPESLRRAVSLRWLSEPVRVRADPDAAELEADRWAGGAALVLLSAGFLWHLRAAASRADVAFWACFAAGLAASAMFVFGEAGFRSLTPVVPFAALALSMGAAAGRERPTRARAEELRRRVAGAAALVVCALCVLGPYAARARHTGPSAAQVAADTRADDGTETLVADVGRAPAVMVVPLLGPPDIRPEIQYEEMRYLLDVGDFPDVKALASQRAPFAVLSAYDIGRSRQLLLVSTRQMVRELPGLARLTVEPLGDLPELKRVVAWEPWPAR